MTDGAAAAGPQIISILQNMMKEVSESIKRGTEQLSQVEVRVEIYVDERAHFSLEPLTRIRNTRYRTGCVGNTIAPGRGRRRWRRGQEEESPKKRTRSEQAQVSLQSLVRLLPITLTCNAGKRRRAIRSG